MARAFTQSNREQIRHALLQKGREYFVKRGLKKTSVDELAKAAGIAKGSFYKFFDSKEALFMAIHEESEEKIRSELMEKLEDAVEPDEKLRLFLKSSFLILEEDPLLQVVFSKTELENLSGFMTSEQYKEHYRQNILFLEELIKQWQEEGIIKQIDASIASNMLVSVFHIFVQRESFGEEMYARVTDMLIECLVNFLSEPKGENGYK